MIYELVIIGAGASGLMAASQSNKKNICIIDANKKIGAKIKISGGAKCNISNKFMSTNSFLGDSLFVQEVLDKFDETERYNKSCVQAFFNFWEQRLNGSN